MSKSDNESDDNLKEAMYSIGDLSKLLNLPASTLRYYDAQGLLVPEIRNEENQYRYYSEYQMMEAMNIIQLKRMGISLENIKLILNYKKLQNVKQSIEDIIDKYEKDIEELKKRQAYVKYNYKQLNDSIELINKIYSQENESSILDLYDSDTGYDFEYNIDYIQKTSAVCKEFVNKFYISDNELKASLELNKFIDEKGLSINGPLTIIFYDTENIRFRGGEYFVEILYPVEDNDITDGLMTEFGGFYIFSTLHLGDYNELPQTFERLQKKIKERGYKIIGPPFEEYLLDYYYLNAKNVFLTRVCYPIAYDESFEEFLMKGGDE